MYNNNTSLTTLSPFPRGRGERLLADCDGALELEADSDLGLGNRHGALRVLHVEAARFTHPLSRPGIRFNWKKNRLELWLDKPHV